MRHVHVVLWVHTLCAHYAATVTQPPAHAACMHSWLRVFHSSCCVATLTYVHFMCTGLVWAVLDLHAELACCHVVAPHHVMQVMYVCTCTQTVCCLVAMVRRA